MVKQLVQNFTSFHFRNLISNAMLLEKVISLQWMVEHSVYEYLLKHDSLERKSDEFGLYSCWCLTVLHHPLHSDQTHSFTLHACCFAITFTILMQTHS